MNESVVESHQKSQACDHAMAELMRLKSELQKTSSQLSTVQEALTAKVSRKALYFCLSALFVTKDHLPVFL